MGADILFTENLTIDNTTFELSVGVAFMLAALIVMLIHFIADDVEPRSIRISVFTLSALSIVTTFCGFM